MGFFDEGRVVVVFYVKFANWTAVRFTQPPVNTVLMKVVQTWHRSYFVTRFILRKANETVLERFFAFEFIVLDFSDT